MVDDDFLVLVNAWWEPLTFTVPDDLRSRRWGIVRDIFDPRGISLLCSCYGCGAHSWSCNPTGTRAQPLMTGVRVPVTVFVKRPTRMRIVC